MLNYETQLRNSNGSVIDVSLTLSALTDRKGEPLGTVGISKDITKKRNWKRPLKHEILSCRS